MSKVAMGIMLNDSGFENRILPIAYAYLPGLEREIIAGGRNDSPIGFRLHDAAAEYAAAFGVGMIPPAAYSGLADGERDRNGIVGVWMGDNNAAIVNFGEMMSMGDVRKSEVPSGASEETYRQSYVRGAAYP